MSPSEGPTVGAGGTDVTDGVGNNSSGGVGGPGNSSVMPKNEIDEIGQSASTLSWATPAGGAPHGPPEVAKTEQIELPPTHMVPQMPTVSTNDNPPQNLSEFKPFNQV